MVRETRHLWVGNLPDNIREEKIREHFKRYGRVQSVKILARSKEEVALGGSGVCATVSFMDIKSASKAHNVEQKLDDRCLSTEYHEPAAIPSASPTIPSHLYPAPTRPYIHGSPLEDLTSFERSSHFYDREREAGYRGRPPAPGYHVVSPIQGSPDPLRNRARDRTVFRAYPSQLESVVTSSRGHHHRVGSWAYEPNTPRFTHHLSSCSSPDLTYTEDRRVEPPLIIVRNKQHLKPPSESRGCSEDRSPGSPSSSSSIASPSGASSSCSSSSSPSPVPQLPHSPSPGPALSDKSSSSHSLHGSSKGSTVPSHAVGVQLPNLENQTSLSIDQRHSAICIKNLPLRSSDTSLKDGLFHEYKRHGKVTCVKVVGQGCDRYALVFFKKTEDVDKALQVSHDKSFFGSKIEVSAYQGHKDVDDNESRPFETDVDEFHAKATRTLFIGNLNSNTIAADLRKTFETFGEIIEIDIKKGNNINGSTTGTYAFVQYIDISSVVKAMRTMDGEFLAGSRINLGFGKSLATACVWIDGVAESVSEKYLASHFNQFGSVTHCVIDRSREHALVFFQQISHAQLAVTQMRGSIMKGRKLQVDFASRECQQGFYEHLDKTSSESSPRFQPHDSTAQLSPGSTNGVAIRGFETPSSSCSSAAGDKSYPRNPDEPRSSSVSVPNPQDMHNLQKERVSLLEQLEDCNSSGDEILNDSSKAQQVKSRPGTPLCDNRPPESLTPPTQVVPRSHVPISLPLPSFAAHVSNPPMLSPPLSSPRRPQSSNSDDSQTSDPGAPNLEERLRSLDEKYEQWNGTRQSVLKLDSSVRLRSRYKLLDTVDKLEPSDIVKSVLAKPSVFDEDTKRLENFSDKYIPKEFVPSRTSPNLQNFRHQQQLGSFSPLTPSSSGSSKSPPASSPAATKTQYSFPNHPQPITNIQNCRTSPPDPRLGPSDPRLLIQDPRLSDPRLSADSRGSFLTKQNICTINDNRYVPDILNTTDPRHPIHKDAEIKDGPEAFYRSKIRDEYTKNWLHTFDRKENEPTYRLVDTFDRRRFNDFRKEEEEKIKIEQITKMKLLDGFVVKRKNSSETVVHPSPFFVNVQGKPKIVDDLNKITEHKKVDETPKREEHIEPKPTLKVTEEIKPPEPPPTVNSIDEDKIDFITNENTIANILLSSIENLHKKTEPEESRCKVERTNSNESVSKLSDNEKKKEVINVPTKKKEHERKKSIDIDHSKTKEKKEHEAKKISCSKSKDCESSKSKELEFNMFEINRINNKKKEELLMNGKTKDTEKKKDLLKSDKKPETKKEDKKKDIVKETEKKDDVDKVKEKKKEKRDKDPLKHKERKKSLDENKHKHETSKKSKEHYKSKEEDKIHQAVTPDSDGKFNDEKESKKDKRIDRNSISSNSSTGRSSKRRMSDSSENLDDSKRSKIDIKNAKDKSYKKTNEKHISFISKILDGKNKEQKKDHHEKKAEKKKEERKIIKTPNLTETEDEDEDEEARERRKNHSIFEVVLDEPYVSMYDKVKARSTKNMQKQEEEKRQEKLKEKFSQLKQSRAKREEKKRSTSYDGDSDSDRGLRRSSKLLITSSDDDDDYFHRKNQRQVSDSSENERPKVQRTVSDSYESNKVKSRRVSDAYESDRLKSQRVVSDSSENEKFKQLPKFKSRIQSEYSDSDDHFVRKSSFTFDRIQSDVDVQGFNGHQKKKKQKKQKNEYSRKSIDMNGTDNSHRSIKEKKKKHSISHKSSINERMQDIFGSLSDEDNDKTIVNKWSVSDVFGTDSDTEHERKENKPKIEIKKLNEFGKDVLKSLSHNVDETARKKKKRKKDKERNKEDRREERREERRDDRKEERKDDRKEERKDSHVDRKEERRDSHIDRKEERRDSHVDRKEERRNSHVDRKEEQRDSHVDRKEERRDIHVDRKEERRDIHVDRKEELKKEELCREDRKDDRNYDRKEEIRREDRKDERKEDRKDERKMEIKEEAKIDRKEVKNDKLSSLINEERKLAKEIKTERSINIALEERKLKEIKIQAERLFNSTHEERKIKEIKTDRLVNSSHEERKIKEINKTERLVNSTHEERKLPREPKHYEEIKVMDNLQSIIESKKKPKEFITNNVVDAITPNRDVFSTFFDFDDSKDLEDETITIFKGDDDTDESEVMFRKVDEKKDLLFRPINTFEPIKREIIGFGSHMDDETAVKSISETPEPLIEEADPVEMASPEEKSTPVISQEETEGAVAALLEASFGQDFCDSSYSDQSAKPDTPVSDSELRIDTDDEDSTNSIIDESKNDVQDSSENSTNLSKVDEEVEEKQDKKEVVCNEKIITSEKLEEEPKSIEKPQVLELELQQDIPTPEPTDTKPQSPLSHNFRLPQMVIQQTSIRPLNINYAKPLAEVKPPSLSSHETPEIIVESASKPEPKTEDQVSVVKYSTTQIPTVICQEQSVISCTPAPILIPKQEFSQPSVLQHTKDTQIVQSCIVSPPITLPEVDQKPVLDSKEEEVEVEEEVVVIEEKVMDDETKPSEELPFNQAATITFAKKSIPNEENVEPEEVLTPISKHEEPVYPVTVEVPEETEDKLMPKHPKAKGLERIVEQINEKMKAKVTEDSIKLTKEPRMMPLKKALIAKEKDENRTDCKIDILDVKPKIVEMESLEDLVVAPLTPKIEDKNEVFASPGESSCEPKELDTARIKKDDEFTKDTSKLNDRDSSVRGRRRGVRGRPTTRGTPTIVTPRRTRQNILTPNMPQQSTLTDVYEFTDEDEKVSQKYSKSPEPPVTSVMPTVPSTPAVPPTSTLVVSTSPLTRKSRRLQEKDGSKSTLEETIDEVARGPCTRRTTRSKPQTLLSLETSPRKAKQINGKKVKAESPQPVSKTETIESTSSNEQIDDEKNQLSISLLSSSSESSASSETTTLIDPVTGLLIPMQESEEGQYVPINEEDNDRNKRSLSGEPPEKKARLEKTPVPTVSKNSNTIPALAVTPNNILPATTTTYAVTPGMSNVAKTPCVMTTANSAPVGLVKPNITASVISPTNILKSSTAPMAPSPPPPIKSQPTSLNKLPQPIINQQPVCKPPISSTTMLPPIKSHLNALSRTPPLPKLLSPKGHIVQAYTSQSMEANNQNSVLHPTPVAPQSSQPLLIHTPGVMSPPLRGVLTSPSRGVLSPPSRGLLSPPSRAVPPSHQPAPALHNSSTVPDIICPKGFDPSKIENSRCIVMRSPSPLVLSGQPMPFEAGIDSAPINMVPAHHFIHPQLIYHPHYQLRDSMGAFIPPRNIKMVPEVEENIPPLELRKRLPDDSIITDRLHISDAQQYMNVPHQVAHPIGSLPYGQVVPTIHYGYRPVNSILKDYPIYWQGTLALKNDKALVEMHYLFGNAAVAEHSLQRNIDGELKLSQRMRLEQTQLDGVSRKMQIEDECCVLIAVPIGMSEEEWTQQSCTLHNGFITYLQQKQAAGIINITAPGSTQNAYIVHMFPPCDYINSVLATVHPTMVKQIATMAHLIIVIATV